MPIKQHVYQNKKQLLIFVGMSIIFIEILLFAIAFSTSNNQPIIQIVDKNNALVSESEARTFSVFKVYLFEKKYGSLDNYRVKIEKKDITFPFRTWLCSSICVPVLIVFLIAFVIKLRKKIK